MATPLELQFTSSRTLIRQLATSIPQPDWPRGRNNKGAGRAASIRFAVLWLQQEGGLPLGRSKQQARGRNNQGAGRAATAARAGAGRKAAAALALAAGVRSRPRGSSGVCRRRRLRPAVRPRRGRQQACGAGRVAAAQAAGAGERCR